MISHLIESAKKDVFFSAFLVLSRKFLYFYQKKQNNQ